MKAINYSRMNLRIEFGVFDDTGTPNPNTGESVKGFVPKQTVWAGEWSVNLTQDLTLQGLGIKNGRVFFVRHNPELGFCTYLRIGGESGDVFKIDNSSVDDGSQVNGFDLITCHKDVNKRD